jgi:hypothetical protein
VSVLAKAPFQRKAPDVITYRATLDVPAHTLAQVSRWLTAQGRTNGPSFTGEASWHNFGWARGRSGATVWSGIGTRHS